MPPLFPPWANAAIRWAILCVAALPVVVVAGLMIWVRTPYAQAQYVPREQPVPFDHRHHVVDDRIDCRYCHTTVERSSSAGIPSSELCLHCHSQIWNESALLAPIRRSVVLGRPVVWQRVDRLPDFVFFDHAVHVQHGVGCETCHGRIDRMARVYKVEPMTMGWCLDCHRDPAPRLRPREAVTVMGWRRGAGDPSPAALARAYDVEAGTDCTTCHR